MHNTVFCCPLSQLIFTQSVCRCAIIDLWLIWGVRIFAVYFYKTVQRALVLGGMMDAVKHWKVGRTSCALTTLLPTCKHCSCFGHSKLQTIISRASFPFVNYCLDKCFCGILCSRPILDIGLFRGELECSAEYWVLFTMCQYLWCLW